MTNKFLPICKQDMVDRGWEQVDFVLVTGDAYVDHHSFGTAIISRVLENAGFKVGIIAQPDWKTTEDFMKLGEPRLGFLVNSGNMDSMVNHYSVSKKHRDKDMYSPGAKMGLRPDRAVIVYCNKIREAYKDAKIIIGGIEASLRRFAHYDYWSDRVRKSMLIDSQADLLVYGMSEKQIVEVANALNDGFEPKYIRHVNGTCYIADSKDEIYDDYVEIPSFKDVSSSKEEYAKAFKIQYDEQDPYRGKVIIQRHGDKYLVQNKPEKPLNREELDEVYALPYAKDYHPIYKAMGGIPAIEEVKFGIVSSRGCFGSCSFCAITFHQGRAVQSRSHESILDEAKYITELDDFKGYIHDVGGPTANFRDAACKKQITKGACKNKQCLHPEPCKNLKVDHTDFLELLRKVRSLPKVKKVFVRSGIRYDYVMADKNDKFFKELVEHHVSGQLKVAPEHIAEEVLDHMQKPAGNTYDKFRDKFFRLSEKVGKKQYIIPYLMSSHPGSTLNSAIELAEYLRDTKYQPEQVQDFYPTPGTLSTTMFYTGIDPLTMKPVYVPKSKHEKAMQRALLQYRAPRNYELVHAALVEAGREDLIGFGPRCLIKPRGEHPRNYNNNNKSKNKNSSSKSSGRGNKKDDSRGKRGNKDSRENNSRNNRNEKNERNSKTNKIKRKKR
ncbi:YgiQ family radical SAM protein [Paraclostridium bifermentans]|uniref:YgiQ family radical SAM protein n=1 Tax=Paraclostridium bifermentans TaxID=1490 RepID=UPI0018A8BBA4|nr:YgiQ family radical SAM protein [Paraclostridium bifermentans]MDU3337856.1 YgiQ family radical SAM protein [Paraclostridium bifermentans]